MTAQAKKPAAVTKPAAEVEFPQFDMSKVNENVRDFAEKAMKQNAEQFDKFKAVSEEASATAEQTLDVVRETATVFTNKIVENTKANTEAATGFFEKLGKVKSVSEALELQGNFFRSQFDVMSAQAKEVQELAVANSEKAMAPAKAAFEKAVA